MQPSEIDRLTFRDLREWVLVERDENGQPKRGGDGDPFNVFAAIWRKRCDALQLEISEEQVRTLFMLHWKNEEEKGGLERWQDMVEWVIPGFREAATNYGQQSRSG